MAKGKNELKNLKLQVVKCKKKMFIKANKNIMYGKNNY